ncbi:hypothetical protein HLB42_20185 (plasmid) [Deinococcus sp. D7000]|nr:hypothetical protein HLB42_20185 [Deinococcus sp. D7000]
MLLTRAALLAAALIGVPASASALTLAPSSTARIDGHAAGTFATLNDPAGFAGGLAWGPDGSAYTMDGARVLYRWNAQTGQPLSRTVLRPPANLPDARADFGPRLRLEGYRSTGPTQGPYVTVAGFRDVVPYKTAFTLVADGRAVLGSLGYGGRFPAGTTRDGQFLAQVDGVGPDSRAQLTLKDTRGTRPPVQFLLPPGRVLDVEPSPDGAQVAVLRSEEKRRYDPQAQLFLDVGTRDGQITSRQIFVNSNVTPEEEAQVRWIDAGRLLTALPQAVTRTYSASGQSVSLWDLRNPLPRWTVGEGALRDAVPSPDGTQFLTVRGGSVPEVRRTLDGAFVRALGAAVTASAPLPDGSALLALDTGNGQGELRTLRPGESTRRLGGVRLEGVTELAMSPDGTWLAAARPGQVTVLDRAGRTRHTLVLPEDDGLLELRFSGSKTLFARLNARNSAVRGLSWNAVTGQVLGQVMDALPVGTVWVRAAFRQGPNGTGQSRLSATGPSGQILWQEGWKANSGLEVLSSPDGRAAIRGTPRVILGQPESVNLYVYRFDPRTGQASLGLTLQSGDPSEPYRGINMLDFAADRRHVLLSEASGDGCGGAFHGLRLADLAARQEVPLPEALTTGLTRFFGCGQPVPRPIAAFTADGQGLLVRDGNMLTWWR